MTADDELREALAGFIWSEYTGPACGRLHDESDAKMMADALMPFVADHVAGAVREALRAAADELPLPHTPSNPTRIYHSGLRDWLRDRAKES